MDVSIRIVRFRLVLFLIILPVIVLFGVIGNVLSIIVLGRDHIQKSTTFTLRALAAADITCLLLCLLSTVPIAILDEYPEYFAFPTHVAWYLFIIYSHPIYHTSQMASEWVLVLVTIERYILVCVPLRALKYTTITRLRIAVLIIWTTCFLFQVPLIFQTGCAVVQENTTTNCLHYLLESHDHNVTEGHVAMTKEITDPLYHLVYRTLGYMSLRFVVPFAVLVYLSMCLAREVRSTRQRHSEIYSSVQNNPTVNRERQGKCTRMVIAISTIFYICLAPQGILLFLVTLTNYQVISAPRPFIISLDTIATVLLAVNSSCNFIIYCVMRENFRSLLKKLCTRNSAVSL